MAKKTQQEIYNELLTYLKFDMERHYYDNLQSTHSGLWELLKEIINGKTDLSEKELDSLIGLPGKAYRSSVPYARVVGYEKDIMPLLKEAKALMIINACTQAEKEVITKLDMFWRQYGHAIENVCNKYNSKLVEIKILEYLMDAAKNIASGPSWANYQTDQAKLHDVLQQTSHPNCGNLIKGARILKDAKDAIAKVEPNNAQILSRATDDYKGKNMDGIAEKFINAANAVGRLPQQAAWQLVP